MFLYTKIGHMLFLQKKDTKKMEDNNNGNITEALMETGIGALGMLTQKQREQRALNNQKELMALQLQNQKTLNQQGHDLQFDMWKKTNYPAQVEMLKEAGLSVGLLYGMKGGGGTTTGNQSGGNASGGNAPAPMDIGQIINASLAGADVKLKKAEAREMNADAENKEMDNKVKKMVGQTADIYESQNRRDEAFYKGQYLFESLKEGKRREIENNFLQEIDNQKVINDIERRIKEETEESEKQKIRYETASIAIDSALKKAKVELTKEQERKIWHDIWTNWTKAGFSGLSNIINAKLAKEIIKKK